MEDNKEKRTPEKLNFNKIVSEKPKKTINVKDILKEREKNKK